MTDIDYAARVARGIALLDEKWPDWAAEIDADRLDIEDGSRCMTAQYAQRVTEDPGAQWRNGMDMLNLDLDSYTECGFRTYDEDQEDYPALTALWRAEILRRRAQGQGGPAKPEAAS